MSSNQSSIQTADILIVDDTSDNLRLLSAMLTQYGFSVRKALSGEMALIAIQTALPDLILLDIMMPDMSGYEVCERLRANPTTAEIPVIFLSALNDSFDKVQAFKSGGQDFITKPFQLDELLVRINNQLALRAAKAEVQALNAHLEAKVKERTYQLELANAELRKMAHYDSLTGLPNRILLLEHLTQLLNRAKTETIAPFAVLVLDCDRFKVINDSLGHGTGDELLIAISTRLQQLLKPVDILARLGGDEFAILLAEMPDIDYPVMFAEQILKIFINPFRLKGNEVFITASIGIASGESSYEQPGHLLRDADTAMYQAKESGRAQYQIFDPKMYGAAVKLLQLETDLRKAVEQEEFIVYYQPIVVLGSNKLIGFEALVRWIHPIRGFVSPAEFIPLAEETGLITQIGYLVLRQSCYQMAQWQWEGLISESLVISVNLSARQFTQPNLVEQIDHILWETKLSPKCLKLEITESVLMGNIRLISETLQKLRERQIQLSIDDFGTGYSSLSYLHRLPIDTLKIDASFINGIDIDGEKLELVRAIINLAWNLGLDVIAEGVETPKQLIQLKALKCQFAQGYLFSKPVDAAKAIHLVATALY